MKKNEQDMEAKLRYLQVHIPMSNELEYFGDAVLTKAFAQIRDKIENFEVRDTDIWVASFPRAGGMFVQELVWLLLNNFNYKRATAESLHERYGHIEYNAVEPPKVRKVLKSPDIIVNLVGLTTRRFIVTYLPWTLLPREIKEGTKNPKIVYIMRNVEDVVVSYHRFFDLFMEENITLEMFFKLFITNNYLYTPFWTNVLSYWRQRERENLLILRYKDLYADTKSVILQTSRFLGATVPENQMTQLIRHLSYEEFAKNPAVNRTPVLKLLYPKNPSKQSVFAENEEKNPPRKMLSAEQLALLEYWSRKNTHDSDFDYKELGPKKT